MIIYPLSLYLQSESRRKCAPKTESNIQLSATMVKPSFA